ncbi:hypothetical protein Dimus_036007 [Dionaea muscipula]
MLKVIKERIVIERDMMQVDKDLYNEAPRFIGSPIDKEKRLAAQQHRIEMLLAEADALTATCSSNVEEHAPLPISHNLNSSFDDVIGSSAN